MRNVEEGRQAEISGSSLSLQARPGSVGWLLNDSFVRDLVRDGIKIRVKSSHSERGADGNKSESTDITRVIFSLPGKGFLPGRRIAEIQSSIIDSPSLTEVVEALHLTVFGSQRRLFHRERIFDGPVQDRAELIFNLRESISEERQRALHREILLKVKLEPGSTISRYGLELSEGDLAKLNEAFLTLESRGLIQKRPLAESSRNSITDFYWEPCN